jgi:hypothetical protein
VERRERNGAERKEVKRREVKRWMENCYAEQRGCESHESIGVENHATHPSLILDKK